MPVYDPVVTLLQQVHSEIVAIERHWPHVELRGKDDTFESLVGALMLSRQQIEDVLYQVYGVRL